MKYKYNGQWYDLTLPAFDSLPVGSEIGYWGNTIPNNYLEEDGKQYLIVDYPELFNVIGHTYDLPTDNDSTKFRVPNNCGRVGVGLDTTQTEFDTLGETGGSKYLQDHGHKGASLGGNDLTSWSTTGSEGIFDLSSIFKPNQPNNNKLNIGGVDTNATPVGDSGNLQPYIVKKYLIKAHPSAVNTSEVVNENSTSETDVYSANYVNNELDKKQDKWEYLYNGNGTNGNVSLSKNISNYSFIEIYAQKSGCYGSVKILAEPNLQFGLSIHNAYDTTDIQQIYGRYTLNSNGSQIVKDRELYMNNNGSPASSNDIYIMKVIGYK